MSELRRAGDLARRAVDAVDRADKSDKYVDPELRKAVGEALVALELARLGKAPDSVDEYLTAHWCKILGVRLVDPETLVPAVDRWIAYNPWWPQISKIADLCEQVAWERKQEWIRARREENKGAFALPPRRRTVEDVERERVELLKAKALKDARLARMDAVLGMSKAEKARAEVMRLVRERSTRRRVRGLQLRRRRIVKFRRVEA